MRCSISSTNSIMDGFHSWFEANATQRSSMAGASTPAFQILQARREKQASLRPRNRLQRYHRLANNTLITLSIYRKKVELAVNLNNLLSAA